MKSKMLILLFIVGIIICMAGCKKDGTELKFPNIPEGYVVDKTFYLSTGEGIYILIKNDAFDYKEIQEEICNKNAEKIKRQYQDLESKDNSPETCAAIKNIIAITDIYLGNYNEAFKCFNDTIEFAEKNITENKNEILAVLYNNIGVSAFYMSEKVMDYERLEKAAKLCEEPYSNLVIVANQVGLIKIGNSNKTLGSIMMQADKLIKAEEKINDSTKFVSCLAVKYLATGYGHFGRQEQAIDILGEYLMTIPDSAQYNLVRASVLGHRGNCYKDLKDYEMAIEDIQNAIYFAKRTVNENTKTLAIEYHRIAICYGDCGDWETALMYLDLAVVGCANGKLYEKGTLYFNKGYACWELEKYDEAKQNFLKSYRYKQLAVEQSDGSFGDEYTEKVRGKLYAIYVSEEENTLSFDEWLEKELVLIEEETEKY